MENWQLADASSYAMLGNARDNGIGSCDTDTVQDTRAQWIKRQKRKVSKRRMDNLPFVVMSESRYNEQQQIRQARLARLQAQDRSFAVNYQGRLHNERYMRILYRLDTRLALIELEGIRLRVSPSVMSDYARNGVAFKVVGKADMSEVRHLPPSLTIRDRANAWIEHARASTRSVLALVDRMLLEAKWARDRKAMRLAGRILREGLPTDDRGRMSKADAYMVRSVLDNYLPDIPRKVRYRRNGKQESVIY